MLGAPVADTSVSYHRRCRQHLLAASEEIPHLRAMLKALEGSALTVLTRPGIRSTKVPCEQGILMTQTIELIGADVHLQCVYSVEAGKGSPREASCRLGSSTPVLRNSQRRNYAC